jgi:hypothetical protein
MTTTPDTTTQPAGGPKSADHREEPSEAKLLAVLLLLVGAQVIAIAVGVFLGWSAARISDTDRPAPAAPSPVVVIQA